MSTLNGTEPDSTIHERRPESKDRLRPRVLLPERKRRFKILGGTFLSIQQVVQAWPQVIFYLFPTLEEFLGGRRFKSDEEVKDAVQGG